MARMQIKHIINPNAIHTDDAWALSEDEYILDLKPEDLPTDAEYIQATDSEGRCVGTIRTNRLRLILNMERTMHLAAILDELDEGIVAVDMEGTIFYVNLAYTKILNVPAGKILGKNMHIIENGANLLEVLKTSEPIERDKQLIQTVNCYVSVRMFPLFVEGKMVGAASVFRDITEINQLNQKLERASQVAAEYNRQIEAQAVLRHNNVIGESKMFVNSVIKASTVADTNATVQGESGVGKEVFTPTRRDRLSVPSAADRLENFRWPAAEHYFWTKSGICRSSCRQSSFARFRREKSKRLAVRVKYLWMCGS